MCCYCISGTLESNDVNMSYTDVVSGRVLCTKMKWSLLHQDDHLISGIKRFERQRVLPSFATVICTYPSTLHRVPIFIQPNNSRTLYGSLKAFQMWVDVTWSWWPGVPRCQCKLVSSCTDIKHARTICRAVEQNNTSNTFLVNHMSARVNI